MHELGSQVPQTMPEIKQMSHYQTLAIKICLPRENERAEIRTHLCLGLSLALQLSGLRL